MHVPPITVTFVGLLVVLVVLVVVLRAAGRSEVRKRPNALPEAAARRGWRYEPGPRNDVAARYRYGPFSPVATGNEACENLLYGTVGAHPMMVLEVARGSSRQITHTAVAVLRLPVWRPLMTISPRLFGSRGGAGTPMQRFHGGYTVETSYPAFRDALLTDDVVAALLAGPPMSVLFFRDELLCWQTRTRLTVPWIDGVLPIAIRLADHAAAL